MAKGDSAVGLCQCGCGQPTNVATRNDASTGRVAGQPNRFLRGHAGRKAPEDGQTADERRISNKRWRDANREHLAAYSKAYYEANREHAREAAKVWGAAHRGRRKQQKKAWDDANAAHKREYQQAWYAENVSDQRAKAQQRQAVWRDENREKHRAGVRQWNRANPAKRREQAFRRRGAGGTPSADDHDYIQVLLGDPCSYCGGKAEAVDHIVALSRGGDNDWTNLTAACRSCNSRKATKKMLFMASLAPSREEAQV